MNDYIRYMFEQYVLKSSSKEFNTLVKGQLLDLKQVDFTKMYKHITTSSQLFNQLNLLMAKGVIKYSPANCSVELSLPNVMVYHRLQKLIRFAYKSLHPHVGDFVNEWIQQGLQNGMGYPIMFEKSLISKVFQNSQPVQISAINLQQEKKKSKSSINKQKQTSQQSKQTVQSYNYHRLVYEYKATEKSALINKNKADQQDEQIYKNKDEQLKAVQTQKKSKSKGKQSKKGQKQQHNKQTKTRQKQSTKTTKQQIQYDQYMLNLQQLNRLFQSQNALDILNSRLSQKQKKQSLFEFLQLKDRQTIMEQLRWQKQQQYLSQVLGQNCLLVFNLIKKYPYITEKQLIKLTLMEVLETRQALNQLLQKGFVYFYYENTRTIVYKIADPSVIYKMLVDSMAKTIINLSLAAETISQTSAFTHSIEQVKNKLIQLQCEIQRLDDILLLFGY